MKVQSVLFICYYISLWQDRMTDFKQALRKELFSNGEGLYNVIAKGRPFHRFSFLQIFLFTGHPFYRSSFLQVITFSMIRNMYQFNSVVSSTFCMHQNADIKY